MLRDRFRVIVQSEWSGQRCDALIALHARRSAASIARYRQQSRTAPLAVVLTGTDLYRDLPGSAEAKGSLDAANQIVVLQDDALNVLAKRWRPKARVIFQSAPPLDAIARKEGGLRCIVVGHLRSEKSPQTIWDAISQLPADAPITIRHVGAALDEALGHAAAACAARDPRYRYEGALPHGRTRTAMRSADLLLHPSVMEGGANVIVEAVMAGTAVLASRVSGNVGMLGGDYPGYFEVGDASGLARLLVQALEDSAFRRALDRACRRRRALFRPEAEQRAVRRLVTELVSGER
jgi:putative glycosyltransferase (TIGR04348 family)